MQLFLHSDFHKYCTVQDMRQIDKQDAESSRESLSVADTVELQFGVQVLTI